MADTVEALLGNRPDTPVTSYRSLPNRRVIVTVVVLLAVAAVAWVLTVGQAGSMSDMLNGLGQVGQRMPNDMSLVPMLGMWAVMMVAMMAPAVIPAVLSHRLVVARRREGFASNAAFAAGFLLVWAVVGVLYLVPFAWFRPFGMEQAGAAWLRILAGSVLVFAGAYRFTPMKARCQQACCAPLTLVSHEDAGRGPVGAFRTGLTHGVHCLGCCWALMTVLLVVGLMNLVWMVALSVLFVIEKHWARGLTVGRVVGVVLVALGVAAMVSPALLHTLSGAREMVPMDMRM